MSEDYSELTHTKRDWRTPLPFTGKPVTKTFYDWNRHRYITCVCILLGAREDAPGTPYAQRPGNDAPSAYADGHAMPPRQPQTKLGTQRQRMLEFLERKGTATAQEVAAALGVQPDRASHLLANDPVVMRTTASPGRGVAQRWALRPIEEE